jgi:uncharacterized protein DUF6982
MADTMDDGRRVVVRFADGRVLKGSTHDFAPNKTKFHLAPGGDQGAKPVEIQVDALKAVFFVKSWEGDPKRVDDNSLDRATGQGRRALVTFSDGEIIAGFTVGYDKGKPGFFMIPADPKSNNSRVFVVNGAVKKLEWVTAGSAAFAR